MTDNYEDAASLLNRLAAVVGRPFGITLGVAISGSVLEFVDEDDDPVAHDGQTLVAASKDEIDTGVFILAFAERVQRAALVCAYAKLERLRGLKPEKAHE